MTEKHLKPVKKENEESDLQPLANEIEIFEKNSQKSARQDYLKETGEEENKDLDKFEEELL